MIEHTYGPDRISNLLALDDSHTFGLNGDDCPTCGDGHSGVKCLHRRYTQRQLRFINAHWEEFSEMFFAPDHRSASNLRDQLAQEMRTLPSRHACSCRCPYEIPGKYPPCEACRTLRTEQLGVCARCMQFPRTQRPKACPDCLRLTDRATTVEIGRTAPLNAPMPMVEMLDVLAGYR